MEPVTIVIPKKVADKREFVLLPRQEYEDMRERLQKGPTFRGYETHTWKGKKHQVPVYQLHGKAAERLDREVRQAMKEYREGKTIEASSMREALEKYERRKKRRG